MTQTAIAYALVIAAAGWVAWRVLLPSAVRTRLRTRLTGKNCGDDCGCA